MLKQVSSLPKRLSPPVTRYVVASSRSIRHQSSTTISSSAGASNKKLPPKQQQQQKAVGKIGRIGTFRKRKASDNEPSSGQLFVHAGLPMIGFSLLAVWVLKSSLEGKTKERETSKGQSSKSERQARMEEEHGDMLKKLNKIRHTDFDNTKRIERPEELLHRRRMERERRNVWYRRLGRWIVGRD